MAAKDEDIKTINLPKQINAFLKWSLIALGFLFVAWFFNVNPFYTVDQTNMAVVKTFGSVSAVTGPGLNFKIPMVQKIERYYVGIETVNFVETAGQEYVLAQEQYPSISVLSNDGLEVVLDVSILAVLKKDKIESVAKSFSGNYELENWRVAAVRASVRDIIALYKADSLYGEKRTEVEAQIKEKIRDRLSEYFELNAVFIRRVTLPQNLKTTIEQKLQAQQEAQKMEYVVQREKLEADRKSIEAKGIATFNELIAKSINDKYLQWYYIQALDKIGNNPNSKVVLLPSSLNNAASSTPSIILNTN